MAAPNTRACARRGLSFSTLAAGPEASFGRVWKHRLAADDLQVV